ncbi:MAG: lectin-like protein, partial [Planctomycetota bacterium]
NEYLRAVIDPLNLDHLIGINDVAAEGVFVWDGGNTSSYLNWAASEPNNAGVGEDAVVMNQASGLWFDIAATTAYRFILELDCNQPVVPELTAGFASGANFPVGSTTVTYTYGNSRCSFNVTRSQPNPTATHCPANITSCNEQIFYEIPTVDLTCSSATLPTSIPGFIFIGTHNSHNYFASEGTEYWSNAEATAFGFGAHLAAITSSAEQTFIQTYVTGVNANHWIGLGEGTSEGTFAWTTGESFSYDNWAASEPNNSGTGENSTEMLADGTWNDLAGGTLQRFIIEFDQKQTSQMNRTAGLASGSNFPLGTTTITHTYGNATCTFTVTRTNPTTTIDCPDDITTCKSQVFYEEPTGTVDCPDCSIPT